MISLTCKNLKRNNTNELIYKTETLTENELMVTWGEEQGEEIGSLGLTCTHSSLLYLKWIINKILLYSTGNSARWYVAAWIQEEFGGEWIHVYVWLSPFAFLLKLPQLC